MPGQARNLDDFISDTGVFADNTVRAITAKNSRDLAASVWPRLEVVSATTDAMAVAGQAILADVTGGPLTITMPPSPRQGDVVLVKIVGTGNTVTVLGNGVDVGTPYAIAVTAPSVSFIGDESTCTWMFTGTVWGVASTAKLSRYIEIWEGTPITNAGGGVDIGWTLYPLFTGQVPTLVTHAGGILTKQFAKALKVEFESRMEMVISANNGDVHGEVNMRDISTTSLFPGVAAAMQSPRSGTYPLSGSSSGYIQGAAGSTFAMNVSQTDGNGSINLSESELILSV